MTRTGRTGSGKILVTGSSNTDLVCVTERLPRPGETLPSLAFDVYPGGKAANQAVAAARAGAQVCFVGAFGDDDYGRARRSELEDEGILVESCKTVPGEPSGLALIAVDRSGENQIVTVGGANDHIDARQVLAALESFEPDVLLFPNEAPWPVIEALAAHSTSALKILNAAPFDLRLRDVASAIDILICNETETEGFIGDGDLLADVRAAAGALAGLARQAAVITLGEDGVVASDRSETLTLPALHVDVIDTTGAGDAFSGAFAAWMARGESFREAVHAGLVASALAVTRAGAQPSLPARARILEALQAERAG